MIDNQQNPILLITDCLENMMFLILYIFNKNINETLNLLWFRYYTLSLHHYHYILDPILF